MKYNNFINSILESRENIKFENSECHHIVPKCLGGTWDSGYIYLTPEEHFIAHRLLVEENPENKKLTYALWRMTNDGSIVTPEDYRFSRNSYINMKKNLKYSEETKNKMSKSLKGRVFTDETKEKLRIANKGKKLTEEHKKKLSDSRKGRYSGEDNSFYGKHHTEESKRKIVENRRSYIGSSNPNYGKKHTEETIAKIRKNRNLSGEGNPSYGTVCVNNGIINKRIKPEELEKFLCDGWLKGMLKYKRKKNSLILQVT